MDTVLQEITAEEIPARRDRAGDRAAGQRHRPAGGIPPAERAEGVPAGVGGDGRQVGPVLVRRRRRSLDTHRLRQDHGRRPGHRPLRRRPAGVPEGLHGRVPAAAAGLLLRGVLRPEHTADAAVLRRPGRVHLLRLRALYRQYRGWRCRRYAVVPTPTCCSSRT